MFYSFLVHSNVWLKNCMNFTNWVWSLIQFYVNTLSLMLQNYTTIFSKRHSALWIKTLVKTYLAFVSFLPNAKKSYTQIQLKKQTAQRLIRLFVDINWYKLFPKHGKWNGWTEHVQFKIPKMLPNMMISKISKLLPIVRQ